MCDSSGTSLFRVLLAIANFNVLASDITNARKILPNYFDYKFWKISNAKQNRFKNAEFSDC